MKRILSQVSLRTSISLISILCSIVVCFLLYSFARDVDRVYSKLIDRDVKARTIIQSIFTQRIKNSENIIKIEAASNTDTIDLYFNKWYDQALEIGRTFDSLQKYIPKDSVNLQQQLDDVIAKRAVAINHTKQILILEKKNPGISILDSVKTDAQAYQQSISSFLEYYNQSLLKTSQNISEQTIKKSSFYISILPIPLIILVVIFLYTLIVFIRNFSEEE